MLNAQVTAVAITVRRIGCVLSAKENMLAGYTLWVLNTSPQTLSFHLSTECG